MPADRDRRRRRTAFRAAAAIACLIAAVPLLYAALASGGAADSPGTRVQAIASPSVFAPRSRVPPTRLVPTHRTFGTAELQLARGAGSVPVPRSFLGFSLEYSSLAPFESRTSGLTPVLALLHQTGDGPTLLRIGGDSADHVYWNLATRPGRDDFHPRFGFLRSLGGLASRAQLKIILDLNLVAGLPAMVAAFAHAASQQLPRESIAALEIGNEPDLYHRQPFYRLAAPRRSPLRVLSAWRNYALANYEAGFSAYAKALARAFRSVPIAGPAVASPMVDRSWIDGMIRDERSRLGMVTAHFYPFAPCRPPSSPMYPTIPRVLGPTTSQDITGSVAPAAAAAHRAALPFHLTEFNSVSCGGLRGVSNTFATALWAPDTLFGLIRAGVDGVNLHIRAHGINAPFVVGRQGIKSRPLLYGLAAFSQTLGPDARLLRTTLRHRRGLRLSAWSVRIRGHILHLLLTNKGGRGAVVTLRLPATAPIIVRRLQASSVTATTGVSLGGQSINPLAQWTGSSLSTTVMRSARGYTVAVPGYSAALLTVPLPSGSLSR